MSQAVFDSEYIRNFLLGEQMYGGVLSDFFHPGNKEMRQMFEQYAMDIDEPALKMEGLKRAGINPLTAAAGIAGAPSSPVPQPAQSTNPIGDIAGAVSSVGSAYGAVAGGFSALSKLPAEIDLIKNQGEEALSKVGLTNAQTQGVITDNSYKDADWESRLNVQRQQFENMKEDYKVIKANHDLIRQKIDESLSQIELNGSIQDYYNSMEMKIKEDNRWQKELNDFRIGHKLFINESGIDGYLWAKLEEDSSIETIDDFIAAYSKYRKNLQYAISSGEYQADEETAYSRAHNAARGQYNADPYQKQYSDLYDQIDSFYNEREEAEKMLTEAKQLKESGKLTDEEFSSFESKIKSLISDLDENIKESNKIFAKGAYSMGHKNLKQSILEDAAKIGIGVGAYGLTKGGTPNPIGFRR